MATKILVVDDHPLTRDGLSLHLNKQSNLEVIGQAANGADAVKMAGSLKPHVVMMDIRMPGMDGIEATRRITAKHDETRIIALSMHSQKNLIQKMFDAGAVGYLLKNAGAEEVLIAIETVMSGEIYLSSDLTSLAVESFLEGGNVRRTFVDLSALSENELRVHEMTKQGMLAKQIANELDLSVRTIETYRARIRSKLSI